jgi:hypothetical protein
MGSGRLILRSLTSYDPSRNVTDVPLEEPENELGDGLLPVTVTVKSMPFILVFKKESYILCVRH